MKSAVLPGFVLVFLSACASGGSGAPEPPQEPPPWAGERVSASAAPSVILTEWRKAENRATCAPLTFTSLGKGADGKPRRANFSGGWAVAWDRPGGPGTASSGADCTSCGRGAFGLAGAGVEVDPNGEEPYGWENNEVWSDGSHAGWGLEGGTGPKWLAYVEIAGQRCLYNVWSHLGREHLEQLIDSMRFVATD